MDWFKRSKKVERVAEDDPRHVRTEGLWIKCDGCRQIIWRKDLEENLNCCPKCGFHFKVDARTRLKHLLDGGEWTEHDAGLVSTNPLEFVDSKAYSDRLVSMRKATGLQDALIAATGRIEGRTVEVCSLELKFIGVDGAVMGRRSRGDRAVAGDRASADHRVASGARMQEGGEPDAVGQDQRGVDVAGQGAGPIHFIDDDPTTGSDGIVRDAGDLNIAEPGR